MRINEIQKLGYKANNISIITMQFDIKFGVNRKIIKQNVEICK